MNLANQRRSVNREVLSPIRQAAKPSVDQSQLYFTPRRQPPQPLTVSCHWSDLRPCADYARTIQYHGGNVDCSFSWDGVTCTGPDLP